MSQQQVGVASIRGIQSAYMSYGTININQFHTIDVAQDQKVDTLFDSWTGCPLTKTVVDQRYVINFTYTPMSSSISFVNSMASGALPPGMALVNVSGLPGTPVYNGYYLYEGSARISHNADGYVVVNMSATQYSSSAYTSTLGTAVT